MRKPGFPSLKHAPSTASSREANKMRVTIWTLKKKKIRKDAAGFQLDQDWIQEAGEHRATPSKFPVELHCIF